MRIGHLNPLRLQNISPPVPPSSSSGLLKMFLASFLLLRFRSLLNTRHTSSRLHQNFQYDPEYLSFDAHRHPTIACKQKFKRCIVCVGGFGDTPAAFAPLVDHLRGDVDNGELLILIPPQAGWDRWDNFKKARELSYTDWKIQCRRAIAEASSLAKEVTVLAHSTWATVAMSCLLTEDGEGCDNLVLTGANLRPASSDALAKKLLTSKVLGRIIVSLSPIVKKKLRNKRPLDVMNEDVWEKGFYLSSFPLHTVREMWKCMDEIDLSQNLLHSRIKSVTLINGEHDGSVCSLSNSVDIVSQKVASLTAVKVEANLVIGAGHNLLLEKEELEAVHAVARACCNGGGQTVAKRAQQRKFFSADE